MRVHLLTIFHMDAKLYFTGKLFQAQITMYSWWRITIQNTIFTIFMPDIGIFSWKGLEVCHFKYGFVNFQFWLWKGLSTLRWTNRICRLDFLESQPLAGVSPWKMKIGGNTSKSHSLYSRLNCSAWLRLKLNTKMGLNHNTTPHPTTRNF